MRYKVVFERAGHGSQADCDRVCDELIRTLKTPPETARAMVSRAPLTVKRDLEREQAEAYRAALESVGATASVVPMEEPLFVFEPPPAALPTIAPQMQATLLPLTPPSAFAAVSPHSVAAETVGPSSEGWSAALDFTPAPEVGRGDWRQTLRVLNAPFDEPPRGATPMTAGQVRASGDGFTLAHPMLERIQYREILLVSAFQSATGRHYIDLYCPGQNRPTRLEGSLIRFETFGLAKPERMTDSILAFIEMILEKSPTAMTDAPTFRFLRDPKRIKCVSNEREMEKYVARLTADLLTPETARPDANVMPPHEAESLLNAPDPWAPPPAAFAPLAPPVEPPPSGYAPPVGGLPPIQSPPAVAPGMPLPSAFGPSPGTPFPPPQFPPEPPSRPFESALQPSASAMPRPYQASVRPAPTGAIPPVRPAPPPTGAYSVQPPPMWKDAAKDARAAPPMWVRCALLGVSRRATARVMGWATIILAVGLAGVGAVSRAFLFAAPFAGIVAFWYWACIRWTDRRNGWR